MPLPEPVGPLPEPVGAEPAPPVGSESPAESLFDPAPAVESPPEPVGVGEARPGAMASSATTVSYTHLTLPTNREV